jgi:hypothetical protein
MNEKSGWTDKLFGGLKKTSGKLTENLSGLVTLGRQQRRRSEKNSAQSDLKKGWMQRACA